MTDPLPHYSLSRKKVFVAGHKGMVGQALIRALSPEGCPARCPQGYKILTVPRDEVDLRNQNAVDQWFQAHQPHVVFLAAARVGGILANSLYPADFIYDNLQIQQNVIGSAHKHKAERLIFLGSSCIYPRLASQPLQEFSLLTGSLEETNQWYAIAKIAGVKLVEALRRQYGCDFISVMPTNLYGSGDTYDAQNSHVIPAMILKFHEARQSGASTVSLWGTGTPLREFLHVDDVAAACIFLAKNYSGNDPVNIGSGQEITIKTLAEKIAEVTGFKGDIVFDPSKPDGTPRKLLDISKLAGLGWCPEITLEQGLYTTYQDFLTRGAL